FIVFSCSSWCGVALAKEDVEGHDVIEEVEDPLEDIDDQVEDDDNMTIDDEYEQDEVPEGQEQHFGDQIHEHDEFIDHHLPMAEGDEDHENHGINLFVDLGPINYGVFMPPDEEIEENGMPPDVPIGEATVTRTTTTISTVNTKGKKEVTILLTSDGNVLKDEMGSKFFQFLFHRAECLFGNTIQVDWRKQANSKKDELFEDVIKEFGNPGFNKDFIMDYARKFIHSKRDKIRSKLTNDLRYPRPAWITNQTTWDELIKDAKFKRKSFKNPNYMPSAREGGKRRLRDTTKATQARMSSIGSHKLGSGGYNSIRGSLVHQFRKEASDEDLKYALMHGSQGLQQHMIDRGEKLVIEHEAENFGSREDTVFLGVFDGHGPYGHAVGRRVRDALPSMLVNQWHELLSAECSNSDDNGSWVTELDKFSDVVKQNQHEEPKMFATWRESHLRAFKVMDKELKLHPTLDCFCSGTTAVTIVKQGQDLVIAHVGDSRAIMGTISPNGSLSAIQLTVDMKANLP
ncbi:hypothetical protein KI387_042429, partial [Taxus chinensis]